MTSKVAIAQCKEFPNKHSFSKAVVAVYDTVRPRLSIMDGFLALLSILKNRPQAIQLTDSDLCRKTSFLLGEYLLDKEHEYNIPYLLQHTFWAVKLFNDPPAYKTTRVELEYVLECLEGKSEFSQEELNNLLKDYYKKDDSSRYDSGAFWNKLFRRLRIAKQ